MNELLLLYSLFPTKGRLKSTLYGVYRRCWAGVDLQENNHEFSTRMRETVSVISGETFRARRCKCFRMRKRHFNYKWLSFAAFYAFFHVMLLHTIYFIHILSRLEIVAIVEFSRLLARIWNMSRYEVCHLSFQWVLFCLRVSDEGVGWKGMWMKFLRSLTTMTTSACLFSSVIIGFVFETRIFDEIVTSKVEKIGSWTATNS